MKGHYWRNLEVLGIEGDEYMRMIKAAQDTPSDDEYRMVHDVANRWNH